MKTKLLAMLVMLALTLTATVCALPALTNVIETASEATAESSDYLESTAEVMAVTSTVPGLNVFTGDTNVETFDGFTQGDIDSMFTLSNKGVELSPVEDTAYGTVIKGEGKSVETWTNFYNQISTSIGRPAFYYMNYKLDTTAVGAGETTIWVINLAGSTPHFGIPATANGEWLTASANRSDYIWGNKLHTFNMKFSGNGSIYVDNYALVPWYKITYKNIDENGNALGDDTVLYYIADDVNSVTVENGVIKGIATSYTVDHTKRLTSSNSSYLNTGWTLTNSSSEFATSVALNNSDIVLYPVWENVGEAVVLYETFEDCADGTLIKQYNEDGSSIVYEKHFSANTKGILETGKLHQGDQAANMSVVDFNGNKVMKIAQVPNYSSSYRMVTLTLTTNSAGDGLTINQPGKYTVSYKYYINDDASLSSIWFRSYYDSSNNHSYSNSAGITRGNWYTYNTSFEIKDDGYSYYGKTFTSKQPVAPYLKRFDFVHSYNSAVNNIQYYIDDVIVTYIPSRHVTVNYKDSLGNLIKSVDTLHYDDVGAKLVTSADLGLDYDAAFTYNGKKYYPCQHIKAASDVSSVDVVVTNTRVVYVESFDSITKASNGTLGITPEYISPIYAENGIATVAFNGGDSGSSQAYTTTTESGRKVLAIKKLPDQTNTLWSLYCDAGYLGKGTYTYTLTYKTDGEKLDTASINLQAKYGNTFNAGKSYSSLPVDSDGYRTAVFNINVYDDADGVTKVEYSTGNTVDYAEKTMSRLMFYWWGTTSTESTVYIDEISVEFKPYAPGEVNLKGYRDIDPVGIRFASYVDSLQQEKCAEYGFIVTRKVFLENAAAAAGTGVYTDYLYIENDDVIGTTTSVAENDDGVRIVGTAAYKGTVDKIYTTDGSSFGSPKYLGLNDAVKFFTGVVIGMTTDEQKAETFVVRPYIKIDGVYYFGTTYESSFNDVYGAANN